MKTKKDIVEMVRERGRKCTMAYLNMILAGTCSASYRLAKVLAEITDTTPELWCDDDLKHLRKDAWKK